jgi:phospholipid transport system substrate-binding protein
MKVRTMMRLLTPRLFCRALVAGVLAIVTAMAGIGSAVAADEPADAFIKRVSADILEAIKSDKSIRNGDTQKIIVLVDQRVMPNVNFLRMTSSAVGPAWRQATPEQQKRLQEEFKILLVRTYAGALNQVSDQTIVVKPLRAAADDKEVIVRTEVRGKGDPIQLDYRVEKGQTTGVPWRVYNMNVMGVWLVDNYRSQFAQEINAKGVDGLIASLAERNKANARDGK